MLKLNGMLVGGIETSDYIKKLPSIYSLLFPKGYEILPNTTELFELEFANIFDPEKTITLLAFFDAMGYARRCAKSIDVLFPKVIKRYVAQITSFTEARDKLNLKIAKARFELEDAKSLPIDNDSIDGGRK